MRPKPLAGIRVLDLTRLLPGPMCTLHLADMGADVIKIEDTGAGDYARTMGKVRVKNAGLFLAANRNKRALRLDLKQAEGREVFLRLARNADVIVESFRPGVVDKLGIGYEAVRAVNPEIVYCALTGYGQTGPYRDRAGHDLNYCGYAGVTEQIGAADSGPALSNLQIGDLLGGSLTAVMGILAALVDANRTGLGRYVDVAMTDSVLAHAVLPLAAHLEDGRTRPRGADMLSGGLPCYNVYRTADGKFMAVGALERKFWELLCETLGRPDLKPFHRVEGDEAKWVKEELEVIFGAQPRAHWEEKFAAVDCCVTPVLTLEESLDNEQLQARGMVLRHAHPVDGELTQFALPLKFSEFEFSIERPAPMPGEHSCEILREAGFSDPEIGALEKAGVI
ncbi:MAG: CoA transferase [Betaproteobacteria bacterium]|nr:CoA transferase [Betaproteobacteria bacterium]